jgi:biopolymer transport protein TolR
MFSRKRTKKNSIISEINVTPFVDILLVVLIIFMVTAPMLDNGFEVNLPKSAKSNVKNTQNTQVVITIDQASNIYYDNKKVTLKQLASSISSYDKNKTQFFIKADQEVKYKEVIDIMSFLSKSGFANISLVTQQE